MDNFEFAPRLPRFFRGSSAAQALLHFYFGLLLPELEYLLPRSSAREVFEAIYTIIEIRVLFRGPWFAHVANNVRGEFVCFSFSAATAGQQFVCSRVLQNMT